MDSTRSVPPFRRRRFIAAVVAVVVLGSAGYSTAALTQPMPTATATLTVPVIETGAAAQIAWPSVGRGALGAVGFDGVLSSSGGEDPFPIASLAKMITSLVVLEHKPIVAGENGPDIHITDDDVQWLDDTIAENGSWAPVVSGSVFTQRQVLEVMMLPSANNYSKTLAIWAFGSVGAFLDATRTWLADHGLTGTTLTNTSGLGASNVSTTRDLVEIGKLALANPVLAGVVSEKTAILPNIGEIENLNSLLGTAGITGMKTGTDYDSGSCILFSAEVPVGATIITVVGAILGADTWRERNAALLDVLSSVPPAFERVQLVTAGDRVGAYSPEWINGAMNSSDVVAGTDASALVWKGTTVTATATALSLEDGSTGSTVGSLEFTLSAASQDQGTSIRVPLTLAADITPATAWHRLTNPAL
ncbi:MULTISPECIES: D-alanyl-D-alanine carboxypeptidase family protein [unclassified Cryobacterium]|uniref:D-alanyl-D-alanine carboxypeptidase family protein n=1 Tax=unclassified Cryobacterium TaxID=2649013 RepID=UPI000CE4B9A7|nr:MULTISPECIES: D-alanyl-D-alanine carboxypeptidase [unclassified Cryobacterium]